MLGWWFRWSPSPPPLEPPKIRGKKSSRAIVSLVGGFIQPIWKICSSNWESSPILGVNIKKIFEFPPPRFLLNIHIRVASWWSSPHQTYHEPLGRSCYATPPPFFNPTILKPDFNWCPNGNGKNESHAISRLRLTFFFVGRGRDVLIYQWYIQPISLNIISH